MSAVPPAVVLFDGSCALCSGAVRFIAAHAAEDRFTFVASDSPEGRALGGAPPQAQASGAGSIVLLSGGRRYERSDAVLHIALGLRAPWPLAFGFILVPRGLRDAVYRWIARNRYRWFGRTANPS